MANLDTLLRIGEKSARIAELEAEAEALRFDRAADMADARKEGASLERIGDAAGITFSAVRKSIETFGPKSDAAKKRKLAARNAERRERYRASKPVGAELEAENAAKRERYAGKREDRRVELEGAGQSDRQS
jgi:hypothetical protein